MKEAISKVSLSNSFMVTILVFKELFKNDSSNILRKLQIHVGFGRAVEIKMVMELLTLIENLKNLLASLMNFTKARYQKVALSATSAITHLA